MDGIIMDINQDLKAYKYSLTIEGVFIKSFFYYS